jgi:hypothetical protein
MSPADVHRTPHRLDGLTSQARYVRGAVPLGRHKARCVAVRLLMPPVTNRTDHLQGIRLSTCGSSPGAHEAFLPIAPAPPGLPRGPLARSLGPSGLVLPQARGLRQGADAPCARLARAPPTPHPPRPAASALRWALASLLPTLLRIRRQLPVCPLADASKTREVAPWQRFHPLSAAPQTEPGVAAGFPLPSSTGPPGSPRVEPTAVVRTGAVGLAGSIGQGCQGQCAPQDARRFMYMHPVASQASTPSGRLAVASGCRSEGCYAHQEVAHEADPQRLKGSLDPPR